MAATTWNPADKATDIVLSNGNLTAARGSGNAGNWEILRATNPRSSGKYYVEFAIDTFPSPSLTQPTGLGVSNSSQALTVGLYLGGTVNSTGAYLNSQQYIFNNTTVNNWFPSKTSVMGLLIDIDNLVGYLVNSVAGSNTGNPMPLPSGALMVGVDFYVSTAQVTTNFGASSFTLSVPNGFAAGWDGVVPATPPTQWDSIRTYGGFTISGLYSNVLSGAGPSGGAFALAKTSTFVSSGKYYCEFLIDSGIGSGVGNWGCGIANVRAAASAPGANQYLGIDTNSFGYFPFSGQTYYNQAGSVIQTATTGNIVCMALDLTNGKIYFRTNNGNWNNSGTANPSTNTGGLTMSVSAPVGPAFTSLSSAQTTVQFGAAAFTYPMPSGFSPWRALAGNMVDLAGNLGGVSSYG